MTSCTLNGSDHSAVILHCCLTSLSVFHTPFLITLSYSLLEDLLTVDWEGWIRIYHRTLIACHSRVRCLVRRIGPSLSKHLVNRQSFLSSCFLHFISTGLSGSISSPLLAFMKRRSQRCAMAVTTIAIFMGVTRWRWNWNCTVMDRAFWSLYEILIVFIMNNDILIYLRDSLNEYSIRKGKNHDILILYNRPTVNDQWL